MSVTKQIKYNVLKKNEGNMIRSDPFKLEFGNSQLIIYHDKSLSILLDSIYTAYDTRGKDYKEFIGSAGETTGYEKIEFHQVFFDGANPNSSHN
jgi:hypothetical protein